jgi:hypothetical protein
MAEDWWFLGSIETVYFWRFLAAKRETNPRIHDLTSSEGRQELYLYMSTLWADALKWYMYHGLKLWLSHLVDCTTQDPNKPAIYKIGKMGFERKLIGKSVHRYIYINCITGSVLFFRLHNDHIQQWRNRHIMVKAKIFNIGTICYGLFNIQLAIPYNILLWVTFDFYNNAVLLFYGLKDWYRLVIKPRWLLLILNSTNPRNANAPLHAETPNLASGGTESRPMRLLFRPFDPQVADGCVLGPAVCMTWFIDADLS